MEKDTLEYLAQRLESIPCNDLYMAGTLVRKVIASNSLALQHPEAEHALFHTVWDCVSRALDNDEFDPKHEQQVKSIESEMAGRVLTFRLQNGWICRSQLGPIEFRNIEEFL